MGLARGALRSRAPQFWKRQPPCRLPGGPSRRTSSWHCPKLDLETSACLDCLALALTNQILRTKPDELNGHSCDKLISAEICSYIL